MLKRGCYTIILILLVMTALCSCVPMSPRIAYAQARERAALAVIIGIAGIIYELHMLRKMRATNAG